MSENYIGLNDAQAMQVSLSIDARERPVQLHDYVEAVRELVDGRDVINIPQSHRALNVGENHEGGHRLNVRIRQGAAWLASARVGFSVTPGSADFRDQSEQMEKFAREGERTLSRGTMLHRWQSETSRDLFECGVSVVQHHPRRDFYIKAQADRTLMTRGARLTDVYWRRRVDPLYFSWDEDNDGSLGAAQIKGRREISEVARVIDNNVYDAIRKSFAWAESLNDSRFTASAASVETKELWFPDRGLLIYTGNDRKGAGSRMAEDDPRRILAQWRNVTGHPPFYIAAASPWPWTSPLDEMIALTQERNYWATMHDYQAAGAIFRSWQLIDTSTGEDIAASLWRNPVPEHVLLDLSKPPPNMGPNTEWKLAPFEFHDVVPRLQMIIQQHESAGASIARLMGQIINANTAVGTADMMEDYARREMSEIIGAVEDQKAAMWADTFRYIRETHTREPVAVAGRRLDTTTMKFLQTHLELRGQDVVAEDVGVTLDTRSRLALIADYRYGREARTNGDMSFNRAVELGYIPGVDDAAEEKADIFVDQAENVVLEAEIMSYAQHTQQNLGTGAQEPPAPPNITRGARTDPRSAGTGRGPDNISDTALATGATDVMRSA